MRNTLRALPALGLIAAHDTSMVVLRQNAMHEYLGMIALLSSATAILFIVVLLSCGMREPIL